MKRSHPSSGSDPMVQRQRPPAVQSSSSPRQGGTHPESSSSPTTQLEPSTQITRINRSHLPSSAFSNHADSNQGAYSELASLPDLFESIPYLVPQTSPLAQNVPSVQVQQTVRHTGRSQQSNQRTGYPASNPQRSASRSRPRPVPYPSVAGYSQSQQSFPGLADSHSTTGRVRVFNESEQPLRSPTLVSIPDVAIFDAAFEGRETEGDSSDLDSPPGYRVEPLSNEISSDRSQPPDNNRDGVSSSTELVLPKSCRPHTLRRGISKTSAVLRRAGPFLIGPRLGASPVRSIVQCLARKEGTDNFYTLKDKACAIKPERSSNPSNSSGGVITKRLCLVLDCLVSHDFATQKSELINLQHHVIKEKKLCEKEAVVIFRDVVKVVQSLHQKNIVHRDLKLGNMVLDKSTRKITLTNFCLGKHLISSCDLLKDQRGSPAYISPDVLSGKPYLGKPSDMWALGVVLFTMLYGQFPFYDSAPQELFRKIKAAEFSIPKRVSDTTISIIQNLLVLDPHNRKTASEVSEILDNTLAVWRSLALQGEQLQVVPDIDDQEDTEPPPAKKKCTKVLSPGLFLPEWELKVD
ncbi:putative serine/threonine-protein kinase 40 isoform X3 [Apostichopus japonicus]|uniref:Serine/threonine-protein kinase 40 n=1 Tax=Stichopus japonicus TaxID=307972 RepID=A0A2G8LEB9_STIJA|nr:putative serine/threonine-protein kinase 40 isoform X3 [Apostichopus japonicus]